MTKPIRRAKSMSTSASPEMPSWCTSAAVTAAPNAMLAMMAALAPAS